MAQLQVVIVTPGATAFDEQADSVILPLYDGEVGIYSGHAPMIGRLGPGEVRVQVAGQNRRFYVDGGFVQVEADVVSVLTGKSLPAAEIDVNAAREALAKAENEPSGSLELAEIRDKAIAQAKAQIRISEKP
jgi:F-type H+-transporting ATPase subunit epsilon